MSIFTAKEIERADHGCGVLLPIDRRGNLNEAHLCR